VAGPQQRLPYSEFLQEFFKQIQDRPKVRRKLVVSAAAKHTRHGAVGGLMEIAMRQAAHIVAAALAAICLCLIAAMPIVAGWRMPAEPVLPAPAINPLELMQQAKHLEAQQITDFSTIY
jgi:CHASE2 domain-containing sensor protein